MRSAMAAYMIIEIEVLDRETYSRYVAQVRDVVEQHGGRYLAHGGNVTAMSGDWKPERVILIEFGSARQARECFASPEYEAIAPLREKSARTRAIIVDGESRSP
jgi:uncharacterized protein (DUF1330 family)